MTPYLLVSGDFVKTGGMDRCNYALASFLADRGYEVHLVAFRVAEDLAARPNVTVHPVSKLANSYFLSLPLLARVGRRWAAAIAARGGRVVVNGGNCGWNDVNWMHHVHALDTPPVPSGMLRRLKDAWALRRFRSEEKAIVPKARIVIATCNRTKQDIVEKLAVPPERVHTVYLGADPQLFRPATPSEWNATRAEFGWPRERKLAVFIGALGNRRKGFDTLFAAWKELCADPQWDVDLVVVGRGAEAEVWKNSALQNRLSERIHFLGFVKNLPAMLSACDVHVLPSRYEGYSLVTQEALCCGIPAFVTASAGIAERYPPELRELLIPDPNDVTDLVARLRYWRTHATELKARIESFSQTLRSHTWDCMAEQMVHVMESAA
jgi:glycosyltransferase involved in cell wall biosynthesis